MQGLICRDLKFRGMIAVQAAKEVEDLRAVLEDLAAKVEDLEAAVREKEATRKTLRDAFAQVAGARSMSCIPLLYLEDAALRLRAEQHSLLLLVLISALRLALSWLRIMHARGCLDSRCCVHMRRCCMGLQGATAAAALLGTQGSHPAGHPRGSLDPQWSTWV